MLQQEYKLSSQVRKCTVIAKLEQSAKEQAPLLSWMNTAIFQFFSFSYTVKFNVVEMGSYKRSTTVIKLYQTRYFG